MSPEQRIQAMDAAKIKDDLKEIADYILRIGWFEQERIFAETMLGGADWNTILQPRQFELAETVESATERQTLVDKKKALATRGGGQAR